MTEVTIGMPVYNNAATLEAALQSLLAQTVQSLRIIISDDHSSDDTASICESYTRRDPRISFVPQPTNLGYGNFKVLLDRAETPFFMWAAGDDRWARTFVEHNLHALNSDTSLAASVSRVCFEKGGKPLHLSRGTYPLLGGVQENIAAFLRAPEDNSRVYSLFRTEVLKQSFPSRPFHAFDWAVSAATLLHGKHNELSEVLMFRDWTAPASYTDLVRKDHSSFGARAFPLWAMTWWLLVEARVPLSWPIAGALVALNIDKHYEYCEKYHPRYSRCTWKIQKLWHDYVRWRL